MLFYQLNLKQEMEQYLVNVQSFHWNIRPKLLQEPKFHSHVTPNPEIINLVIPSLSICNLVTPPRSLLYEKVFLQVLVKQKEEFRRGKHLKVDPKQQQNIFYNYKVIHL